MRGAVVPCDASLSIQLCRVGVITTAFGLSSPRRGSSFAVNLCEGAVDRETGDDCSRECGEQDEHEKHDVHLFFGDLMGRLEKDHRRVGMHLARRNLCHSLVVCRRHGFVRLRDLDLEVAKTGLATLKLRSQLRRARLEP